MENTSNKTPKKQRDIFYYRQRLKNRVFTRIISFFAEEAERSGITKKDVATILNKDPAQVTRWLSSPSNMTLDTISDLLLAMEAEIDPPPIVRFADRVKPNYAHPLIDKIIGAAQPKGNVKVSISPPQNTQNLEATIVQTEGEPLVSFSL